MITWLNRFDPVVQALFATLFTWFVTALGAATVFLFKTIERKVLDGMLGFAGGVMIAASFWSLLSPAIDMSGDLGKLAVVPAAVGFLLGGGFLRIIDMVLPHLHINAPESDAEGIKTKWHKSILLVLAITLHNIPEGLAVGVAFGAVAAGFPSASLAGAVALAVGIGIQNFPEGASVAIPLYRGGFSKLKSFMYGQSSGLVEPISGVLGALAVIVMRPVLPYALSFAAGAMIFVVVEEVIPESQSTGDSHISTLGVMLGFTVMMALDVIFG